MDWYQNYFPNSNLDFFRDIALNFCKSFHTNLIKLIEDIRTIDPQKWYWNNQPLKMVNYLFIMT